MNDTGDRARILDLSRLISRVGLGAWTGVDRVEARYLARLLEEDTPLFSLVRSSFGFMLFDEAGTRALADRLFGAVDWGPVDLVSRLFLKAHPDRQRAESDVRRLCAARSGRRGLADMLGRYLPGKTVYINVGHSNLRISVFDALRAVDFRSVVLVHDTIPLDHPNWQRDGTVDGFAVRMRLVATRADLVVHTAAATRQTTQAQFERFGRVPPAIVAHLGIDRPVPEPGQVPAGLRLKRPYFVVLGTIEPRKNHAFLLDIWDKLSAATDPDNMPRLYIIGRRGWRNEAVFARLDAAPAHVRELGMLGDGAVAALLNGASGLLMPSFVEGFGLPPGEALSLGCPVIASDLPVYREVFGNNIVYADPHDLYSWSEQILAFAGKDRGARTGVAGLPTWDDHFNTVLKSL